MAEMQTLKVEVVRYNPEVDVHFRVVAHHFNFQCLHLSHSPSPSSRRLLLLRRKRV